MQENQYIWFIVNSVLGVLFIIWASIAPSMPLIPGNIWMILPGSVLFLIGTLGIAEGLILERRILKVILNAENGRISLEALSEPFHMDPRQILEIIISLRLRGKLHAYFDGDSGEIFLSQNYDGNTCSLCGEPINTNQFCSICRTSHIEEHTNT